MSPLILAAILLPLFALTAWFPKRLRDAVAKRQPDALRHIDSLMRSVPRRRRALERRAHYRMLQDAEIDRHIRNGDRLQILVQYAWLALFASMIVLVLVSAMRR